MKFIAHRGNLNGPNPKKENCPDYVENALKFGYDVEIDVWHVDNKWHLGHDVPQYENVSYDFLLKPRLWLHAKNGEALYNLLKDKRCNVFYHTDEDWVLTSKRYIWTYPGEFLYPNSICVLPELGYNGNLKTCVGVCSDYITSYEESY
jgi:hypothetical protein